jgi:hypothetical protein
MEVSITGTALNPQTFVASPFAMTFDIAGGTSLAAGCDSYLMGASVTNFSAEIGNNVVQLPASFSANLTSTEYPSCASGDVYGELVAALGNAPAFLTLQSQGPLLTDRVRVFDGNLGAFYIQSAQLTLVPDAPVFQAVAVPEPSSLTLLALGVAMAVARRSGARIAERRSRKWWRSPGRGHAGLRCRNHEGTACRWAAFPFSCSIL